jgi:hypothetical protein
LLPFTIRVSARIDRGVLECQFRGDGGDRDGQAHHPPLPWRDTFYARSANTVLLSSAGLSQCFRLPDPVH